MLRFNNNKGSALMQVLVLGSVIAAIVLLVLRFSVTRTTNIVKTKRRVAAKAYAEACMAQYNSIAMERELNGLPPLIEYTCTLNINKNGVDSVITNTMVITADQTVPYSKIEMDIRESDKL